MLRMRYGGMLKRVFIDANTAELIAECRWFLEPRPAVSPQEPVRRLWPDSGALRTEPPRWPC